jgi:hypothetical protein
VNTGRATFTASGSSKPLGRRFVMLLGRCPRLAAVAIGVQQTVCGRDVRADGLIHLAGLPKITGT